MDGIQQHMLTDQGLIRLSPLLSFSPGALGVSG